MNKILSFLFILFCFQSRAQTPTPLFFDVTVNKVMTIKNYAARLCYSKVDQSFYYMTLSGDIYKVNQQGGTYSDSLVYSSTDHSIQSCQGFVISDSVMYVSGNNDKDSLYTKGFLMKGVLQANNTRIWSTVAQTVPYLTSGPFDHWISGLGINKTADTLFLCSGSRGDHGEVGDNGGLTPFTRNLALTSLIFQIPITANGLIIPNDSIALDAQQLVFVRGIRNTYDMAFNASGDVFGAENSGDRDMEDELNWLQRGHHYGFPWLMGSSENPQQYPGYNPLADSLINHKSAAWMQGKFYNDSTFPQKPATLITDLPCLNNGPDAAFMRDSTSGLTYNASAIGQGIYSFTPHRSPLGLVFDTDSILGGIYNGNGFVLSYTRGDSLLSGFSKLLSPFNDASEDLLLLTMKKDTINHNYSFTSKRLVSRFQSPIDAVQLDTSIFVIEIGGSNSSSLWRIDFPKATTSIIEKEIIPFTIYPNPCKDYLQIHFNNNINGTIQIKLFDVSSRLINNFVINDFHATISIPTTGLSTGSYLLEIRKGDKVYHQKFVKE